MAGIDIMPSIEVFLWGASIVIGILLIFKLIDHLEQRKET